MTETKKYEVAVIIPTLNEERFIERCLNCVLRQSFPQERMDICVVDGGSTDRTEEIVRSFAQRYTNIRLIGNPKRIQSVAFNIGVAATDAPFVVRLDAHAAYEEHYIERCVFHLQRDSKIGNVGGIWDIQPQNDGLIASANAILNKSRFGIGGASFRVGAVEGETDTVPFGAFRREVISEIGGMREDLARGEDNEYNSRIHKAGYIVYLDPTIQSTYYARDTMSGSCKQMYANGKSIGRLFYVDRQSIGLRHLVPFAFFLSLLFSLLLGCFTIYGFCLLALILLLYFSCAIAASLMACRRYGYKYIFILPILFFSVHLSYGAGTLIGLLKL